MEICDHLVTGINRSVGETGLVRKRDVNTGAADAPAPSVAGLSVSMIWTVFIDMPSSLTRNNLNCDLSSMRKGFNY